MTVMKEKAIDLINRMPEEKLHYIMAALKDICQIVRVEGVDSYKILAALDNEIFEDML